MIVSTTNTIEGMKIAKTINAIEEKSNLFTRNARESARRNLKNEAEKIGANAIIEFKIRQIPVSGVVYASGTAVIVEEI